MGRGFSKGAADVKTGISGAYAVASAAMGLAGGASVKVLSKRWVRLLGHDADDDGDVVAVVVVPVEAEPKEMGCDLR